jgi:predicted N-acetyltransferase YhbS
MAEIRPMTAEDAPAAMDVVAAAFEVLLGEMGEAHVPWSAERRARSIRRTERFVRTDPDGCWVATDADRVVGMTIAIRRQRLWGLAMLFVHPEQQSGRVGTGLIEHARRTADGADLELIMSSPDPRAVRRYASLGLALHPALGAKGEVDRSALPADLPVREGAAADLDLVEEVDRRLRGVPRSGDIEGILADDPGARLLVADAAGARGFAVHTAGNVTMLGADDEATARALLWAVYAEAEGDVEAWGWTATQGWAFDVALAARLKLVTGGAMFARGIPTLPGPYLPSGVYF